MNSPVYASGSLLTAILVAVPVRRMGAATCLIGNFPPNERLDRDGVTKTATFDRVSAALLRYPLARLLQPCRVKLYLLRNA